jgi:predicted transcriptional regulator
MKSLIPPLLQSRGPLTLEQISEQLGNPHPRTLRSWLADLRNEGRIAQRYNGRTDHNGRWYTYDIARAYKPMPSMRATEYRHARPSGTPPERVRRLMRLECNDT